MGVSENGFVLAGKLTGAAVGVAAVPVVATREVCQFGRATMFASLAKAGVSSFKLRNARGRLGVRTNVLGRGSAAVGMIKASGPWPLIEADTPPHRIERRGTDLVEALKFPGPRGSNRGGFARDTRHPGTHGKHPWREGADAIRVGAPKVYEAATASALFAAFR